MKHRVTYFTPGILFPEEYTHDIEERDPQLAVERAPANTYCFNFYDVEEAPDLGADFKVVPVAKNKTKRYYIGGTLYTLAEVEALGKGMEILASNMRGNHWDRIIKCVPGNWQPFEEGDVLL